jgi:hypothetical protein
VASQISPSGMTLAGKYGIGIISLGSMSTQGLMALPTQWGFAEDAAKKHGTTVSRSDWRVLLTWHIAETREQARREAGAGLMRWHNEYNVGTLQRPGLQPFTSPEDAVEKTADGAFAASTIGTPDDLVKMIKNLMEVSGGVGAIIGFAHDWANIEATRRSWDMVARYVIPEINGYLTKTAGVAEIRDRESRRVRARRPGRDGQDHGERKGRRRTAAHRCGPRRDPDRQRAGLAEGSRETEGVRGLGAQSPPSPFGSHALDRMARGQVIFSCRMPLRGKTIVNSVNSPSRVSTLIVPPCCFTMMSWLIESPSPVPSPAGLVVKNGLNIFSVRFSAMPVPLSRMRISTPSPRFWSLHGLQADRRPASCAGSPRKRHSK